MSRTKEIYTIRDPNKKVNGGQYIDEITYSDKNRYFVPRFKPFSKSVSDDYIRYPVYNPYLKHYIWLNRDSFISYLDQNEGLKNIYKKVDDAKRIRVREYELYKKRGNGDLPEHYNQVVNYPYQSIDMRRVGAVRFAPKEDLETWIRSRDEIRQKIGFVYKRCPTSLPSEIDIFKMKRNSNSLNYKYIYQIDEQSIKILPKISEITDKFCQETDIFKIFVPYLEGSQESSMKEINNIQVFDEDKFVDRLSQLVESGRITNDDKGRIIYQLNNIFKSYQKFQIDDIDVYLKEDMERLYGLNKSKINEIISDYKTVLEKLRKSSIGSKPTKYNNCDELMDDIYQKLSQNTTLEVSSAVENSKELCYYRSLNLESLINKLEKHQYSFENCETIPFRLDYVYEHATKDCSYIDVENQDLLNGLKEMGLKMKTGTSSNFKLNSEFIPEWVNNFNKISEGQPFGSELMHSRQLILGDLYSVTEKLQDCSLILLSDPWYQMVGGIQHLSWSFSINKMVLACMVKKDIKFPIRIEMGTSDRIQMYKPYDIDNGIFLGTFLFKVRGKRTNFKNRFYELFVYYDIKRKRILMYNFRANEVVPGTVNDHVRVFYIELNVLKYFNKDIDPDMKLYYYRKKGSTTYYVSKLSSSEIDNDDLQEVILMKDDNNKEFYFSEIQSQSGGKNIWQVGKKVNLPIIKSKYSFYPEYSSKNYNFSEAYPKEILAVYLKTLNDLIDKLGDDFFVYDAVLRPLFVQSDALKKVDKNVDIAGIKQYTKDWSNISKKIVSLAEKHKLRSIVSYPFESTVSLLWFDVINKFSLLKKSSNVFIISKNGFGLDTVIYYQKFVNYSFNNKKVFICLDRYNPKFDGGFTINIIKRNKIGYHIFTNPLNISTVNEIDKKVEKKVDFAFIDLNIVIRELRFIRTNYTFQTILSSILIALKKLAEGGNMLLYVPDISNIEVFNFYVYLKQFFKEGFIYENSFVYWQSHFNNIVLKGYKGGIDTKVLEKITTKNFECDPSGGFNYQIENKKEAELLNILYKSKNPPKCYLNKILNLDASLVYREYCELMKNVWQQKLDHINDIYHISQHPSLIPEYLTSATLYNISHIKSLGLKTVEWLDDKGFKRYFYHTLMRTIHSSITPYNKQFQYICGGTTVGAYKEIEYRDKEHTLNIWKMSENVYQYVDKTDYRMWKNVELFFNNKQKTLQKFLKDEYNININGRYVSRAWIKMYELLNNTKYFKNLNKYSVKVLHICEAPGSFIASSIYYTKHNTEIKDYDYTAQSWKEGDIFDEFGFIKQNPKRWDFADGTGDIMKYKNLQYYYKKYKGVDSLVGDCGVAWDPSKKSVKDLSVYQMLYSILIPREGGNFVIKSYAVNYNLQFLSLLYLASCKFEKLYIFRASRNIWSPEIYVVGIGKKKISDKEVSNLFEIAKGLEEGKVLYPTSKVGADFSLEYEYHTQNVTRMYSEIKKFFVYLARNPEEFKKEQPNLDEFIHRKNIIWLKDNMKHLDGYKEKYIKYSKK